MDQQNFLSYRHVFMDANVSILYVLVFAFNIHLKGPFSMHGFKQIITYILAIKDASRLKPLEVYLVIHEIAHQVNFNSG